jgi:ankyrin repeat protein
MSSFRLLSFLDVTPASRRGHVELARLLLSKGANVHATEYVQGKTPLHNAAENNHADVARLLLDHGADLRNSKTKDGRSALDMMASSNSDIATALLEHQDHVHLRTIKTNQVYKIDRNQPIREPAMMTTINTLPDPMETTTFSSSSSSSSPVHDMVKIKDQVSALQEQIADYKEKVEYLSGNVNNLQHQIHRQSTFMPGSSSSGKVQTAFSYLHYYTLVVIFGWCCWRVFIIIGVKRNSNKKKTPNAEIQTVGEGNRLPVPQNILGTTTAVAVKESTPTFKATNNSPPQGMGINRHNNNNKSVVVLQAELKALLESLSCADWQQQQQNANATMMATASDAAIFTLDSEKSGNHDDCGDEDDDFCLVPFSSSSLTGQQQQQQQQNANEDDRQVAVRRRQLCETLQQSYKSREEGYQQKLQELERLVSQLLAVVD